MSLRSLWMGAIAAVVVYGLRLMGNVFPVFEGDQPLVFATVALFIVISLYLFGNRSGSIHYTGLADLIIRIQNTPASRRGMQWGLHGLHSALLNIAGGTAGVEGAAIEVGHAAAVKQQKSSAKWFEEWRRSDVSSALAAGISAAFGAPFAAVVLPLELTIGGNMLGIVTSSISAFVFINLLEWLHPVGYAPFSNFFAQLDFSVLSRPEFYLSLLVVSVLVVVLGWLLSHMLDLSRSYVESQFDNRRALAALLGSAFILLIYILYPDGQMGPTVTLAHILDTPTPMITTLMMLFSRVLLLVLVVSFIGTAGVIWPVVALGALCGQLTTLIVGGNSLVNITVGMSAALGAFFGAPVAGALLVFEVSNNIVVLAPALAMALFAQRLSRTIMPHHMISRILESKGFAFERGRSVAVLNSIMVADAMVTDHITAAENETVESLYERLKTSRYPFVPVVNKSQRYIGMLTADAIEDAFLSRVSGEEKKPKDLGLLIEVRDLLQRSQEKFNSIPVDSSLGQAYSHFERSPVVPVVGDENQFLGLLFVYDVRIRYDQETAKRRLTHKDWTR